MSLTARDIAVRALRDRSGNITAHLERLLGEGGLSGVDRGLAHEITVGVVRHRSTVDAILRSYLHQRKKKVPSPVKEILQVAIYQIVFLQKVPAFAAVDEAVKQIVRSHHKRQSGMVNGILRTMIREMNAPIAEALEPAPAENIIPLGDGRIRRMGRTIFHDPQTRPHDYYAQAYSLPPQLTTRWIDAFGEETARDLMRHTLQRPPLICRVNTLKTDIASAIAALAEDGIEAIPHENGLSVILPNAHGLTGLAAFAAGLIQPQDPTATKVVASMKLKPGMRVLDFCAAPGTKTTHIAERLGNEGEILAVDVSRGKLSRVTENCERMGIDIVKTILADEAAQHLELRTYDAVLLDVPCSNTGVLARRPEARWRFEDAAMGKLIKDQQFIAMAGAQFVRPGGQLVYSTCSIEHDEDQHVAKTLAKRADHLHLKHEERTLPTGSAETPEQWYDGGYFATFQG
ncbi:MAG: methyltransferase domain-containing protein [Phycisphaerales bacterium]|jgi:16S rRNA (cytosine967-C5)-methyltransferase|nr:methyltransferase domain-containing protein [Phycisphaerales bacterium]MBT7170419.1 methyltransferase domain-containing protein [Phycisphaerales bacterium]